MVNLSTEWDTPGRAQEVDAYWRSSPDEREYRARLAALVHEAMAKDSDTLLELGCGSGLVFEALTVEIGRPPHYVGIDGSAKMLAIARRRYKVPPNVFHAGNAELLDHILDGKFDIPLPLRSLVIW